MWFDFIPLLVRTCRDQSSSSRGSEPGSCTNDPIPTSDKGKIFSHLLVIHVDQPFTAYTRDTIVLAGIYSSLYDDLIHTIVSR